MSQPPEFDPNAYYGDPSALPPPPPPGGPPGQPEPTEPMPGYGYPAHGTYPPYHGGPNPDPWAYAAPQTAWSPYAAPTSSNGLAQGSMIVGILSLVFGLCCCLGAIGGIVAVALGFVARGQIAATGGQQSGSGQAQAGIICGALAIVIAVGFQVLGLALGSFDFSTTTP